MKPTINSLEDLPGSNLKWIVKKGTSLESLFLVQIFLVFDKYLFYIFDHFRNQKLALIKS